MPDVIVIGGGIAGLTAAYLLKNQNPNLELLVLEEQSQAGGNIKSLAKNGFLMETGPHSFMGSAEYTWKLVYKLGLEEKVEPAAPASKSRYIYRHNRLKPLPMGILPFVSTTLLTPAAKMRLMMEPFVPNGADEKETAWNFFCRRFGKEAATFIMTPFISGIYAGDIHMLGARAAFSKFWKFEKESGSMIRGAFKYMKKKRQRLKKEGIAIRRGMFSFNGGLGTITRTLAEKLPADSIKTGVTVTNIRKEKREFIVTGNNGSWRASTIITAAPPTATGTILKELLPQLEPLFAGIPMAPVAMIHWRVKDTNNSYPKGFGFLMPRLYDLKVLGTLFPAMLFQNRIKEGWQLFTSFYGGMTDPDTISLSDEQLSQLVFEEHRRIFNKELDHAEVIKILRYKGTIPQLLPQHPEKIKKIKETISNQMPGLFLAGNYLTGVGIEQAVESGFNAFENCNRYLTSQTERRNLS